MENIGGIGVNDPNREDHGEKRGQWTNSFIPEQRAVTGFTFKGMGMLLLIVAIIGLVKYFFR